MRVRGPSAWLGALVVGFGSVACSDSKPNSISPISSGQSPATDATVELWPAPADPLAATRSAGLVPETKESLAYHVHAHLDVFVDGQHITIPAGIGIDITNPGVKQFTDGGQISWGGIEGCDRPCISPLHTHDVTGILHTESATEVENTLGQFFIEWGQRLDDSCVASYCEPAKKIEVYIDAELYGGNPVDIALSDHREIAIVIGTPPAEIPATADFSAA
jgi:hypothetical protein